MRAHARVCERLRAQEIESAKHIQSKQERVGERASTLAASYLLFGMITNFPRMYVNARIHNRAVGSKRVVVEHVDDILKIKAGLVDLEYEIGGEAIPTKFMGFEFTDGCDWHSDGVSLCQTKVYTYVYTYIYAYAYIHIYTYIHSQSNGRKNLG